MARNSIFDNLLTAIRTAVYGKDVREAIASSIEMCYDSASGDVALDAAQRANLAADRADTITDEVEDKLADLDDGLVNLDNIVKVSTDPPTEEQNKIWVQTQDDTEYRIPTFAAYEELWSEFQDIRATYESGNGGIKTITENPSYNNPNNRWEREYIVTFANDETTTFHVNDGQTGAQGPTDRVVGTDIFYHAAEVDSLGNLVSVPPTGVWSDQIPTLASGEYLWTQTVVRYSSGARAYIYGISRNGIDGSGAVNSVAIGSNGTVLTGDIKLPIDSAPTSGSGNLMTSGDIYQALQGMLTDASLSGIPTAPTAASGTNTQQVATTAFVQTALSEKNEAMVLHVTTSVSTVTFRNSSITQDTFCYINSTGGNVITWTTTNADGGTLTLNISGLSGSTSFDVIIFNTVAAS